MFILPGIALVIALVSASVGTTDGKYIDGNNQAKTQAKR